MKKLLIALGLIAISAGVYAQRWDVVYGVTYLDTLVGTAQVTFLVEDGDSAQALYLSTLDSLYVAIADSSGVAAGSYVTGSDFAVNTAAIAGKQDTSTNYAPTTIVFGNATQDYDIDGITWVAATAGIPDAGSHLLPAALTSIATPYDDSYLAVREGSGAASATNPLTTTFTFPTVTSFNVVKFRTKYVGSASHEIVFELWNGATWDTFITMPGVVVGTNYTVHSAEIWVPAPYLIGGTVTGRFRHENAGVTSHYLMIDYIVVASGGGSGGNSIQAAHQTPSAATGNIAATNVQDAIAELESEKLALADSSGADIAGTYVTGSDNIASLALKAPIADPTFTGEIGIGAVNVSETELGILEGATPSTAEINYVDDVTSPIQTQLDAKLNTADTVDLSTVAVLIADSTLSTAGSYATFTALEDTAAALRGAVGSDKVAIADSTLSAPGHYATFTALEDSASALRGLDIADTTALNTLAPLLIDTLSPMFYYGYGGGLAGDTVYADVTLNAPYGHYYVAADSLEITNLITNVSSGDTIDFSLVYNDSLYVSTACDTIISVNAGSAGGKISGGTLTVSTIPPGNYIWIEIDAVVAGSKPIWFRSDLMGYIKRD